MRWLRVCTLEGNVITSLNPLSYLSVHSSEQGKAWARALTGLRGQSRDIPLGWCLFYHFRWQSGLLMSWHRGQERGRAADWGQWKAPSTSHSPALPSFTPLPLISKSPTSVLYKEYQFLFNFYTFYWQITPLSRQILVRYYACSLHVQFCWFCWKIKLLPVAVNICSLAEKWQLKGMETIGFNEYLLPGGFLPVQFHKQN